MNVGKAIEVLVEVAKHGRAKVAESELAQAVCIMEDFVRIAKADIKKDDEGKGAS